MTRVVDRMPTHHIPDGGSHLERGQVRVLAQLEQISDSLSVLCLKKAHKRAHQTLQHLRRGAHPPLAIKKSEKLGFVFCLVATACRASSAQNSAHGRSRGGGRDAGTGSETDVAAVGVGQLKHIVAVGQDDGVIVPEKRHVDFQVRRAAGSSRNRHDGSRNAVLLKQSEGALSESNALAKRLKRENV